MQWDRCQFEMAILCSLVYSYVQLRTVVEVQYWAVWAVWAMPLSQSLWLQKAALHMCLFAWAKLLFLEERSECELSGCRIHGKKSLARKNEERERTAEEKKGEESCVWLARDAVLRDSFDRGSSTSRSRCTHAHCRYRCDEHRTLFGIHFMYII